MLAAEIIKKKRNNEALTSDEINHFILAFTRGEIPDYQMSAMLMAIYLNGMNTDETIALTKAMLHSGTAVDTSAIPGFKVDKHSTGGVGDKTSLILGPIVAAAGVYVPMISGRGLGHTGGTLDKLESIPGFNTQQSLQRFVEITKDLGTCFIGQTKEICPADKKIYALRDVTATIESLPLICASIMSKKLAEGIDGLVLDVKFGSGAFMKTVEQADTLARALMKIGQGYGKKMVSVLSSMDQPLGRFSGNALEVFECVEIMKNKKHLSKDGFDLYSDTRELSLQLSAHMIYLSGKTKSILDAYRLAEEMLISGRALAVFEKMVITQGGHLDLLPRAKQFNEIRAKQNAFVSKINVETIGLAGIVLRAGRQKNDDLVHPTSGIEFHVRIGDQVKAGDLLFTIHGDEPQYFEEAQEMLTNCIEFSLQKPADHVLIKRVITDTGV